MPVAFGWSAGDIAKAIDLLATVYKGLRATGGADTEFQETAAHLRGLISTLEHLQHLEVECTSPSLVNAVRTLSQTALRPIFQFVEDVSKYEPALKQVSTASPWKAGVRKAQWAVCVPKKLTKLKADVLMELQPIHLLLASETMKQACLTKSRMSSLQSECETEARNRQSEIKTQAREVLKFETTLMDIMKEVRDALGRSTPAGTVDYSSGQQYCQSESHALRQHSQRVKLQARALRVVPQLSERCNQLRELLCVLLLEVLTKFATLTRYLLSIFPQSMLFLRTLFMAIPTSARLLIHDDIHFEDVLGRVYPLPYRYFQIWEVFQVYLKNEFKGRAGEHHIQQGAFYLLNAASGWKIEHNQSDWTRSVLPGSRINMSVILPSTKSLTACPRCCRCLNRTMEMESKLVCPNCCWERTHDETPSTASSINHHIPSIKDISLFKRVHTNGAAFSNPVPRGSIRGCYHGRCSQCQVVAKRTQNARRTEFYWYCCNCGDGPNSNRLVSACLNGWDHDQ